MKEYAASFIPKAIIEWGQNEEAESGKDEIEGWIKSTILLGHITTLICILL